MLIAAILLIAAVAGIFWALTPKKKPGAAIHAPVLLQHERFRSGVRVVRVNTIKVYN